MAWINPQIGDTMNAKLKETLNILNHMIYSMFLICRNMF